MKNITFTTLFSLLTISIFAQNWAPINLTDKYNFENDTADFITNTIWVDSVSTENGDSVFHLNRIVTDCDFCTLPYSKLKNQGQFLQKEITKTGDGKYHFQGENSFVIFPEAELNDFWLFDTSNNIAATVVDIYEDGIFGNTDSLKFISLSNNFQIVLSKNHGLLHFPEIYGANHFDLVGIEGRDLGESVPNSWDFYDFEEGDIFQFTGYEGHFEDHTKYTRKYIVENKTVEDNTVTFDVKILSEELYYNWATVIGFNYSEIEGQWIFQHDSLDHYVNYYPNQLYTNLPYLQEEEKEVNYVSFYKNEEGFLIKCLNDIRDRWDNYPQGIYIENDTTDILDFFEVLMFSDIAQVGLGVTNQNLDPFEGWYAHNLEGYIKGGDTTGIISPDSFFSNTQELFTQSFNLYPNPSEGRFYLDFKRPFKEDLNLSVLNAVGENVFQNRIQKGESQYVLALDGLPKGVYFLNLVGDERQFSTRLVIE